MSIIKTSSPIIYSHKLSVHKAKTIRLIFHRTPRTSFLKSIKSIIINGKCSSLDYKKSTWKGEHNRVANKGNSIA